MTEVDIEDAFRYPLRGDGAWKLHAVFGGLPVLVSISWLVLWIAALFVEELFLLSLLLFPLQLVVGVAWMGYFVRVARATLAGEREPPGLGDWGRLARDGIVGSAIAIVYQVPGVLLTAVGYGAVFAAIFGVGSLSEGGTGSTLAAASVVSLLLLLVVFVVAFLYFVVAAYLLPASVIAYADEGRVRTAFSVSRLKTVVWSMEYAVPWMVAAGVYVGVVSVMSFLTSILVGYLLVPFMPLFYFFLGTMAFYTLAQSYAIEVGIPLPDESGEADGRPARPSAETGDPRPDDT